MDGKNAEEIDLGPYFLAKFAYDMYYMYYIKNNICLFNKTYYQYDEILTVIRNLSVVRPYSVLPRINFSPPSNNSPFLTTSKK